MPITKTQIINGGFQDSLGNPLNLGFLTMELSQDEQAPTVGQVGFGIKLRVPLVSSGNVAGTVLVWGNDVLLPANSYYTVSAFTASGQLSWGPQYQQVVSGATFNLSTWVPNSLGLTNQGAVVNSLNGETGAVNILPGTNVTVVSSGQNITISATAGAASRSNLTGNGTVGPFTLPWRPDPATALVFYGGTLQDTSQYTITTNTITFIFSTDTGAAISVIAFNFI